MLEAGLEGLYGSVGARPGDKTLVDTLYPACEAIKAGKMKRVMIIGKGSLFLGRLTNLADGGSFLIEAPTGAPAAAGGAVSKEDVKALILEALSEIAGKLN